jgi:group I intron endonuclease
MENKGEIYIIICNINKKRYIGQAVCFIRTSNTLRQHGTEKRWIKHIQEAKSKNNRCRALNAAIQKYGSHNFDVKTMCICQISQLNYFESKYIRQYNTISPFGYNLRQGGGSKGRHSVEAIEKLRAAKSGENNHMFGKHHSDSAKQKISEGNKGKVRSKDYRIQMSKSKGRKEEYSNLPMYVYYEKQRKFEGYVVKHHPNLSLSKKSFVSSKYSMQQKLQMATEYVNNL